MRFIKVLLLLAIFVLGILFFAQNSTELGFGTVPEGDAAPALKTLTLQYDLYFGDLNWKSPAVPLYIVILASFAAGAIVAIILLLLDRIRIGCALMNCKRAQRALEKELDKLRADKAREKEAKVIEVQKIETKELPPTKNEGAQKEK